MKNLSILLALGILICSCNQNQEAAPLSPRINHVMLYVSDLQASIDFYTTAFDLEVSKTLDKLQITMPDSSKVEAEVKMAFLKFPGQDFVYELSEQASFPDSTFNGTAFQHVGIDVLDIDAALQRALDAGGELLAPIRLVEGNGVAAKNVFLKGPDGEYVELMQMISGEF